MRLYILASTLLASLLLSACAHSQSSTDSQHHGSAANVVVAAKNFIGTPYRTGGNGETGYDCSGFVHAMYRENAGVILPRRAFDQAHATKKISRTELQPGDLVFFNTLHRSFSHVGIYVGDNHFVHSPSSGGKVRIDDMQMKYWARRFEGARRVPAAAR